MAATICPIDVRRQQGHPRFQLFAQCAMIRVNLLLVMTITWCLNVLLSSTLGIGISTCFPELLW